MGDVQGPTSPPSDGLWHGTASTRHVKDSSMKRRLVHSVALVLATSLALVGCGGGGGRDADRSATLRVAQNYAAQAMDPHKVGSTTAAFPYVSLVYDRLTQMGPKLELELMLATDWEFSEDGRSVTFTLRDDVTFSDGAVLDAAAVKASLDRALTLPESTVRAFLTMIESV